MGSLLCPAVPIAGSTALPFRLLFHSGNDFTLQFFRDEQPVRFIQAIFLLKYF